MDVCGPEDRVSGCSSNPWPDIGKAWPSVPRLGSLEAARKRLIKVNTDEQRGECCPRKLEGKKCKTTSKNARHLFLGRKGEKERRGEKRSGELCKTEQQGDGGGEAAGRKGTPRSASKLMYAAAPAFKQSD